MFYRATNTNCVRGNGDHSGRTHTPKYGPGKLVALRDNSTISGFFTDDSWPAMVGNHNVQ